MKALVIPFCVAILMLKIISAQAKGANLDKVLFDISYANTNITVRELPLNIRDIPNHNDDSLLNAGPIEQTDYSLTGMPALGFFKQYKNISKNTIIGFNVRWIYPISDSAKRNYTNAVGTETRGYGAALTEVSVEVSGILPYVKPLDSLNIFLNFSPEVVYDKILSDSMRLGASLSFYRVQVINGWDRYDSFEANDSFNLAHVIPVSVYFTYDKFTIGGQYPIIRKTSTGEQADVGISKSIFISISY